MIWYDMIWNDVIWYDMLCYDMIQYDMIQYDMIWCEMRWWDEMMRWDEMMKWDEWICGSTAQHFVFCNEISEFSNGWWENNFCLDVLKMLIDAMRMKTTEVDAMIGELMN
jgi:hypothetical protein